jgi:predicted anti-sigma-YlaC factor YlaD
MLSCQEVIAELAAQLEGEPTAQIRRELERHLAECRTCEVLYDSARKTLRIVTDSGSFDLPEGVSERIVKKVMDQIQPERLKSPGDPES